MSEYQPLTNTVISEIESFFDKTLHEIEPLGSGEYALYTLELGYNLYITTYFQHAIVRFGYAPLNCVVYSHCDPHSEPGKVMSAIKHCLQQLDVRYSNNHANLQALLRKG